MTAAGLDVSSISLAYNKTTIPGWHNCPSIWMKLCECIHNCLDFLFTFTSPSLQYTHTDILTAKTCGDASVKYCMCKPASMCPKRLSLHLETNTCRKLSNQYTHTNIAIHMHTSTSDFAALPFRFIITIDMLAKLWSETMLRVVMQLALCPTTIRFGFINMVKASAHAVTIN